MREQQQQLELQVNLITSAEEMEVFRDALADASLLAVDIETAYWWDKAAERISLIQLGVPQVGGIDVWMIDCFAELDLTVLQELMLNDNIRKVIHNAGFDVMKLRRLANIIVENVFDTMLAARRAGEKGCSLAALAARHLGIQLNKKLQRSDWSRRPLDPAQLEYAANDVIATLMLYDQQQQIGLDGEFVRRRALPRHEEMPVVTLFEQPVRALCAPMPATEAAAEALVRIVTQFPGRYTPQSLATCLGRDRGGLPGWIVDEAISRNAFVDYNTAISLVIMLLDQGRLIDRGRRLSIPRPALLTE